MCGRRVPAGTDLLFEADGMKFGVEICEDLWSVVPPSSRLSLQGADVIFNLSASNALAAKTPMCAVWWDSSRPGACGVCVRFQRVRRVQTDVVFGSNALIYENGTPLAFSQRFSQEAQLVSAEIDVERLRAERMASTTFRSDAAYEAAEPYELIETGMPPAPVMSLSRAVLPCRLCQRQYAGGELPGNFQHSGNRPGHASGACARQDGGYRRVGRAGFHAGAVGVRQTFDRLDLPRKGIIGVTMPGFGTTDRTYQNALTLMKNLGVTVREVDITQACRQHFCDIGHDEKNKDITYENTQARERTQVLMDIANQTGGLVIGTGDLSELALGWATYNGDHMSMYGVNAGVPKTLVRSLVAWAAQHETGKKTQAVLADIVDTPISPELLPAAENGAISQKTEDLVGPYELHDFFLFYFLRYGFGPAKIYFLAKQAFDKKFAPGVIKKWLKVFFRRFFAQQFKRSCLPDGPKVGSVSLSPRGDWRMPSDASAEAWLAEAENLR